jgi:adenine-specific DNA-methyltransferase
MRYIGSKVAALPKLSEMVAQRAADARSICDPFAGTCTVARHFKQMGFGVTTGDLLRLSYVFQLALIRLNHEPAFEELLDSGIIAHTRDETASTAVFRYLDNLAGYPGYVTQHFSEAGEARRLFFTAKNAMRIDAVRSTIADWRNSALVSESDEAFLLTALINAADKVANTAATYFAYLKRFSPKAVKSLSLRTPTFVDNRKTNTCRLCDARILARSSSADILYLDPPYNERDYSGYYHLPETLARWDRPLPSGKSGVPTRARNRRSNYCIRSRASAALEEVVGYAKARYIIVHYSPEGLIPHGRIMQMLGDRGPTIYEDLPVRSYSATASSTRATIAVHRIYWCQSVGGTK